MNFFKKQEDISFLNQVLNDNRPVEEKKFDLYSSDVFGTINVEWKEKKDSDLPKWPVFNQKKTGSCFPGKTLVLMENFEYKPIVDVNIGDNVITHKGNIKTVTHKFNKIWQGLIYKIKVVGECDNIEATGEHPFYAIKKNFNKDEPDFYKISELKKGDYLAQPTLSHKIEDKTLHLIEKDPEFLWILGLYLAEGSIEETRVIFSIHRKEKHFFERIKVFMEKYNTNVTFREKNNSNSATISVYGKYWSKIFLDLGGKLCDKKFINSRLMYLEPSLQMNIVKGIKDGDGHILKQRKGYNITSTSLYLLNQIRIILLRNKKFSTIIKQKIYGNRKQQYRITVFENSKNSFFKNDFIFTKINSIKKENYSGGNVYNLEVKDDNTYIVKTYAVHNCVYHALAKMLGIINYHEEGKFIEFSRRDGYSLRSTKGKPGSNPFEALKMASKRGLTLESLMPSKDLTESQMESDEDRVPSFEIVANIYKAGNFFQIATNDMNNIAYVISQNKPVMLCFSASYNEWNRDIVLYDSNTPASSFNVRHAVAATDFLVRGGKNYILIDESWGTKTNFNGQRLVPEEYFTKGRCFFAGYLDNLNNYAILNSGIVKPKYEFNRDLTFNDRNEDVKFLQQCLSTIKDIDGYLFPVSTGFTGFYGSITALAVKRYQKLRNIVPATGILDQQTRYKLNDEFK